MSQTLSVKQQPNGALTKQTNVVASCGFHTHIINTTYRHIIVPLPAHIASKSESDRRCDCPVTSQTACISALLHRVDKDRGVVSTESQHCPSHHHHPAVHTKKKNHQKYSDMFTLYIDIDLLTPQPAAVVLSFASLS